RATRSSAVSTAVTPPYADERTTTALANDPRARSISCGEPWRTRTPGATTREATSTRAALCSTSTTARRLSAARVEASAAPPTIADRSNDVYGRLLKERIVFLGTQVDDTIANLICAQLLLLAAEDDDRDVYLYINSPGGSVTAGMAIYDTMQYIGCDVATICMGLGASMGQFLLCAGTPGKRFALPHAP